MRKFTFNFKVINKEHLGIPYFLFKLKLNFLEPTYKSHQIRLTRADQNIIRARDFFEYNIGHYLLTFLVMSRLPNLSVHP